MRCIYLKRYNKMIFVSLIVALASQVSIGLMESDFMVSAGIISFVVFFFYYTDLKPIPTGVLSGIMVYLSRLMVYYIANGKFDGVIVSYLYEILFYVFYSIIYSILMWKANKSNINLVLAIMIVSDLIANLIEVSVRSIIEVSIFQWKIISTLLIVSVIRSVIVWIILIGFKYYKMLLLKEEHEDDISKIEKLFDENNVNYTEID